MNLIGYNRNGKWNSTRQETGSLENVSDVLGISSVTADASKKLEAALGFLLS